MEILVEFARMILQYTEKGSKVSLIGDGDVDTLFISSSAVASLFSQVRRIVCVCFACVCVLCVCVLCMCETEGVCARVCGSVILIQSCQYPVSNTQFQSLKISHFSL